MMDSLIESLEIIPLCKRCGKPIPTIYPRGSKVPLKTLKKRVYCSFTCQTEDRRIKITKICEYCHKEFGRPRVGIKDKILESMSVFAKRRFCSNKCKRAFEREHGGFDSGKERKEDYREFLGDHCEACGTKENLHVHHIDGNHNNNNPDNTQTLCENCHGFWHAALTRSRKGVVGRMPQLFILDG